jgi:hypothetical protein
MSYFCFLFIIMKDSFTYKLGRFVSCIIMMMALAWLTVSIPFVYASQQQNQQVADIAQGMEEETNPFANTTEEKSESGANTLSEYLHDMHANASYEVLLKAYSKCHPSDLYYAFHPELISPPPEFARS